MKVCTRRDFCGIWQSFFQLCLFGHCLHIQQSVYPLDKSWSTWFYLLLVAVTGSCYWYVARFSIGSIGICLVSSLKLIEGKRKRNSIQKWKNTMAIIWLWCWNVMKIDNWTRLGIDCNFEYERVLEMVGHWKIGLSLKRLHELHGYSTFQRKKNFSLFFPFIFGFFVLIGIGILRQWIGSMECLRQRRSIVRFQSVSRHCVTDGQIHSFSLSIYVCMHRWPPGH